jgi:hypothetical protein
MKTPTLEPPPTPASLLTAVDVAGLLKVDPATVRMWARTGKIPPPRRIGHGRNLRWAASDLRSLLGDRGGAASPTP